MGSLGSSTHYSLSATVNLIAVSETQSDFFDVGWEYNLWEWTGFTGNKCVLYKVALGKNIKKVMPYLDLNDSDRIVAPIVVTDGSSASDNDVGDADGDDIVDDAEKGPDDDVVMSS